MATIIDQQVALDEALVPSTHRLRIGRSNFRLPSDIQSKEATLQVVYDVLRNSPFFRAFLVTADVPKIYMQEFWATAKLHHNSIRFKMDTKKSILDLDAFREMLHISPRIPSQSFAELPSEEEILEFFRYLGHSHEIRYLTDVNDNKLYKPWRSFASVINKCLTGKSSGIDSFRLSQAQILWGFYHRRNTKGREESEGDKSDENDDGSDEGSADDIDETAKVDSDKDDDDNDKEEDVDSKNLLDRVSSSKRKVDPSGSGMAECLALADLGVSINLMPFSVWKRLYLPDLTPTRMTLELADCSISRSVGVAEDVYVKVAYLILGSMTRELHRQFKNSSPYDMIKVLKSMFEKQDGVERFEIIQTFHACKQEEGKPVVTYVLQMKGYVDQLERLGYVVPQDLIFGLILNGRTKDFARFVRNYNLHNMGKIIGELHAMLIEYEKGLPKKAKTPQGFRESRKLKQGAFYLYVGNGVRAQVEVIGSYDLVFPNGLGCEALVKRDTPDKLQQRSVKFIFIGYPKERMGYYFYFSPENKIVVASSSCSKGLYLNLRLDYEETFSPVADIRAIRFLISIAYKDDKTLFAGIQTRFGGNEAIKKTQKTLLKQMYENFNALNTESLDSIFNMLRRLNLFPPLNNPELTIRRRSRIDPTLLTDSEMVAEGNGDLPVPDLRTMEELYQPSLNGQGGPSAPIAIQETNFGLKNDMIQQVQNSCQFYGLPGDDANKHLDKFLHVTQSIKVNGVTDDAFVCSGTLPGNTITNPKEDLKGITTRSGTAYQGPTIPTTSSFIPSVVECETEATNAMVQPTNNESTNDVQPPVVQTESPILNSEPINKLSLPDLSPTCMTLELADHSISRPAGVAADVFIKTERALIDVFKGELTFRVGKEAITFNLDHTSRYSANYNDMTANRIDVIDMACEEYSQEVLGFSDVIASGSPNPYYDLIVSTTSLTLTPFGNSDFLLKEVDAFLALEDDPTLPKVDQSYVDTERDILLLEAILNDDPSLPPPNQGNYLPQLRKEQKICEAKSDKSLIDQPPEVELKDLPPHLEHAFLE
nr:zinc finger, CCHC-type [Tanacetum cinerariifolium]